MQSWILLALPQVLEAKSQRLLQLLCHGKGLVPRGGRQKPQGGQGGMLLPGLGTDSSMSQAAGEVEQGSVERRLKAPGPTGAGSSVLGRSVQRDLQPQSWPPHAGRGRLQRDCGGLGAPRRPRAEKSKDSESGPGFTV